MKLRKIAGLLLAVMLAIGSFVLAPIPVARAEAITAYAPTYFRRIDDTVGGWNYFFAPVSGILSAMFSDPGRFSVYVDGVDTGIDALFTMGAKNTVYFGTLWFNVLKTANWTKDGLNHRITVTYPVVNFNQYDYTYYVGAGSLNVVLKGGVKAASLAVSIAGPVSGTWTANVTGGTLGYSYNWTSNAGVGAYGLSATGAGLTFTPSLPTGAYTLTCAVTDSMGTAASATTSGTLGAPSGPLQVKMEEPVGGIWTVVASGGTTNYTYTWGYTHTPAEAGDPAAGSGTAAPITTTAASSTYSPPLPKGNYTVTCTVTDAVGAVTPTITETGTLAAPVNDWIPAEDQTLTFASNGGSAVTAITQAFGTTVSAPVAPTKMGYTFVAWYDESGLTTEHTFSTMGLSTTVYAKWTAADQTLTFASNGGASVTAITQAFGTTVSAPMDPARSSYTFAGWYNESGLTTGHTFSTMGLSTTVYAKWTADDNGSNGGSGGATGNFIYRTDSMAGALECIERPTNGNLTGQ